MQGPDVEFTRLWDDDIKKYAYYTLIDGDPAKRAYLLPVPDDAQTGHRKYTVRAVQTLDQTATGKYVFESGEIGSGRKQESNILYYAAIAGVALLALAASYVFGGGD